MKALCKTAVTALTIVLAGSTLAQSAGNYDLRWNTPAAGAAAMSGACYTLTGSVGQNDANPAGAMIGGAHYALRGGFWTGVHDNDAIFRDGFDGC